jgi:hypothetical protein
MEKEEQREGKIPVVSYKATYIIEINISDDTPLWAPFTASELMEAVSIKFRRPDPLFIALPNGEADAAPFHQRYETFRYVEENFPKAVAFLYLRMLRLESRLAFYRSHPELWTKTLNYVIGATAEIEKHRIHEINPPRSGNLKLSQKHDVAEVRHETLHRIAEAFIDLILDGIPLTKGNVAAKVYGDSTYKYRYLSRDLKLCGRGFDDLHDEVVGLVREIDWSQID